jgi:hypothetical protein
MQCRHPNPKILSKDGAKEHDGWAQLEKWNYLHSASAVLYEGGARGAALDKRPAGGQTPVVGPKLFQAALDGTDSLFFS